MQFPHARMLRLSARLCGRLCLGLLVLAGLCLALGVSARPALAHSRFSVTDCSSDGQLQADVTQANHDNAGDVITFACSGDLKLSSTLTISGSMTLSGSGQSVTLDGGDSVQVLNVQSGVSLSLKALTIAHGSAGQGGQGGGLFNDNGTVSITNSTFSGNSAPSGSGGGLLNEFGGTVSITNSTFSGNSAPGGNGGGLFIDFVGTVSITNSTFSGNGGGQGGGLFNSSTVNIGGSIVANNTGGDCDQGGTLTDQGYNLESGTSCGFTGMGSLQNTDPKLGPLTSHGGRTQTLALLKGSPAIDVIPLASGLCPATDQRGHKRPDNPHEIACDIGAFES